jgi:hypothetical protein
VSVRAPNCLFRQLLRNVAPGKWMALIFLIHATLCAIACGTPDGSVGGKCKTDACEPTCDEGASCDLSNNTCYATPSVDTSPPTIPLGSTCDFLLPDACAPTQIGFACGAHQQTTIAVSDCTMTGGTNRGQLTFCCSYASPTDAGDDTSNVFFGLHSSSEQNNSTSP